jgi:hypothetical protein
MRRRKNGSEDWGSSIANRKRSGPPLTAIRNFTSIIKRSGVHKLVSELLPFADHQDRVPLINVCSP